MIHTNMIGFPLGEICSQSKQRAFWILKYLFRMMLDRENAGESMSTGRWGTAEERARQDSGKGSTKGQRLRSPRGSASGGSLCGVHAWVFHCFVGNTALVAANLLFEMLCVLPKVTVAWMLCYDVQDKTRAHLDDKFSRTYVQAIWVLKSLCQ